MATLYSGSEFGPRALPIYFAAEVNGEQVKYVPRSSESFAKDVPYGKVPALVVDGQTLTEEIAIIQYVNRKNTNNFGGASDFEKALVNQWLSFAIGATDLFAFNFYAFVVTQSDIPKPVSDAYLASANRALDFLETVLKNRTYLVGESATIADYTVVSTLTGAAKTVFDEKVRAAHPNVLRYFKLITNQKLWKKVYPDEIKFPEKALAWQAPKKEKKAAPAPAAAAAAPAPAAEPKKPKHPLEELGPAKSFPIDEWKRQYSNNKLDVAFKWLEDHYDPQEYSFVKVEYKYPEELTQVFMSSNLITGFHFRLDASRKYLFGSAGVYGTNGNNAIMGIYLIRGSDWKPVFTVGPDYESYNFTPIDFQENKKLIYDAWDWENTYNGLEYADGKVFK